MSRYESWGRYPRLEPAAVRRIHWRDEATALDALDRPVLPFGLGRSYGDSCLNDGGYLLDTTALDRFLELDETRGLIRCEAGVSLEEILRLIVPRGWFLPVTPGTKFVTVGGAIANDVHGKNHHVAGTFGCHVTRFELLRSDGERLVCSREENIELFRATIGGLGLTGLILWAEFSLIPIRNSEIEMEKIRFSNLDEFYEISARSDRGYDYTMSWLDCLAEGRAFGRGHFMRGNHAPGDGALETSRDPLLSVPVTLPSFLLNPTTMRLAATAVYYSQPRKHTRRRVHYEPFFYPLDAIGSWNRAYGRPGFMQYQCVVPHEPNERTMREIVRKITASGLASFLAVFKEFGEIESPGMLSFPRPGLTLALDFPNNGLRTLRLFDELDVLVRESGGALYPAKDARMSAASFATFFPRWREFERYIDPRFSSSFWRRVTVPVTVGAEVPA